MAPPPFSPGRLTSPFGGLAPLQRLPQPMCHCLWWVALVPGPRSVLCLLGAAHRTIVAVVWATCPPLGQSSWLLSLGHGTTPPPLISGLALQFPLFGLLPLTCSSHFCSICSTIHPASFPPHIQLVWSPGTLDGTTLGNHSIGSNIPWSCVASDTRSTTFALCCFAWFGCKRLPCVSWQPPRVAISHTPPSPFHTLPIQWPIAVPFGTVAILPPVVLP